HGPDVQEGNLRLDRRSSAFKGGDSGPAVVPGKPDEGFLIEAVHYGGVYEMPPAGKLPAGEIALLTDWVRRGAPWPDDPSEGEQTASMGFDVGRLKQEHWSWSPIVDHPPPKTGDVDWPLNDIDCFILDRLQQHQLTPAPPADRSTWLRRVTYDL